jgi:hypothetical protein
MIVSAVSETFLATLNMAWVNTSTSYSQAGENLPCCSYLIRAKKMVS